jgi:Kef-type K+ transport system membrane component KefB
MKQKLWCVIVVLLITLCWRSDLLARDNVELPISASYSLDSVPNSSPQLHEQILKGGEGTQVGHSDPFTYILLVLGIVSCVAGLGRLLAKKTHQPDVLGELLIGVFVGNLLYFYGSPIGITIMHLDVVSQVLATALENGLTISEAMHKLSPGESLVSSSVGVQVVSLLTGPSAPVFADIAKALWMFSNLGVILLLFLVGLENDVDEMMKVGLNSLLVAIAGVVAPFVLGYMASWLLIPDASFSVHLFLGATLCATSVGITARVFKDLSRSKTGEAKIILGAAVIDDILGLIILAVVVGIISTGTFDIWHIGKISLSSVVFLATMVFLGGRFLTRAMPALAAIFGYRTKILLPLSICFFASWLSNQIGLASIVGAFAAGLIIREYHFDRVPGGERQVEELISPLETLFAPIFFVLMGMQVNLGTFLEPSTLILSGCFITVAIIGKLVSGLFAGSTVDKLAVGVGMIPRGEVGLIFASIGKGLGVVNDSVFSATVIMVMVTTLITPPALKWALGRADNRVLRSISNKQNEIPKAAL